VDEFTSIRQQISGITTDVSALVERMNHIESMQAANKTTRLNKARAPAEITAHLVAWRKTDPAERAASLENLRQNVTLQDAAYVVQSAIEEYMNSILESAVSVENEDEFPTPGKWCDEQLVLDLAVLVASSLREHKQGDLTAQPLLPLDDLDVYYMTLNIWYSLTNRLKDTHRMRPPAPRRTDDQVVKDLAAALNSQIKARKAEAQVATLRTQVEQRHSSGEPVWAADMIKTSVTVRKRRGTPRQDKKTAAKIKKITKYATQAANSSMVERSSEEDEASPHPAVVITLSEPSPVAPKADAAKRFSASPTIDVTALKKQLEDSNTSARPSKRRTSAV